MPDKMVQIYAEIYNRKHGICSWPANVLNLLPSRAIQLEHWNTPRSRRPGDVRNTDEP